MSYCIRAMVIHCSHLYLEYTNKRYINIIKGTVTLTEWKDKHEHKGKFPATSAPTPEPGPSAGAPASTKNIQETSC